VIHADLHLRCVWKLFVLSAVAFVARLLMCVMHSMLLFSEFFHRFAQQDIRENAARRVAKFLKFTAAMEQLQHDYENRARSLIEWTQQQQSEFASSPLGETLEDAQAAHAGFRNYLTTVKPPKLAEKLDVETLFAELQTELLVNDRRAYNPPADLTVDALEAAFDGLAKTERDRGQAVRQNRFRFIKKEESKLPQEKIDEITASFKHFDKNSNGFLEKVEFKAALAALGVPFKTEDDFNRVFSQVSEGNAVVSLEQYIRYNTKLIEDRDSPDQVRDSFLLLSDNGTDISSQQLFCPPLSEQDVAYLTSRMPQNDQGRFDFNTYITNTFSNA
jgi:Ca2+-binding EF-hand superfamily protein